MTEGGRSQFALVLLDDPVVHYRILHFGEEVMRIEYGTRASGAARLVAGDAWYVLREDKVAAVHERRGGFLQFALASVPFTRSWSLHDSNGFALARVRRAFHLSPTRDRMVLVDADGGALAEAAHRSAMGAVLDVRAGDTAIGTAEFRRGRRELHVDVPFERPIAALLAYATHQCFGHQPGYESGAE